MNWPWLASIAAQAVLAAALYRAGKRDLWLWYLVADLAISAAMLPLSGIAYWWAYFLTSPIIIGMHISAVNESLTKKNGWLRNALLAAAVLVWWSIWYTAADWPRWRRASLLMRQAGAYGCLGALIGGRGDRWLMAYFAIQSLSVAAQQIDPAPAWARAVGNWQLGAVALLFSAWAIYCWRFPAK